MRNLIYLQRSIQDSSKYVSVYKTMNMVCVIIHGKLSTNYNLVFNIDMDIRSLIVYSLNELS